MKSALLRLLLAMLPACSVLAQANLLQNGSFEQNPGRFMQVYPGSTALPGWTIEAGNIDLTTAEPGRTVKDGNWLIDLDGYYQAGTISQTFATKPGVTYLLSFYISGNPAGHPVKSIEVTVAGEVQTFHYDISTGHRWDRCSLTFRASGNSETLRIRSLSPATSTFGAFLDDFVVVGVGGPPANIEVKFNRKQNIAGFGGSLAMWGYSPDSDALVKVTQGLGINIIRVQGDAGGYSPAFSGNWESSSNTADAVRWRKSTAAARASLQYGVDTFVLTFWYPPAEFLDNKNNEKKWPDDKPTIDLEWAKAIAARVDEFCRGRDGVPGVWTTHPSSKIFVSPQNEPNLTANKKGIWAYWTPDQLSRFIVLLRRELNERFGESGAAKVQILAPELTSAQPWDDFKDLGSWESENDPFASISKFRDNSSVAAIGYHMYDSYAADEKDPGLEGQHDNSLQSRAKSLKSASGSKPTWMTETTGPQWNTSTHHTIGWKKGMNEIEKAVGAARYLHHALVSGESSAFLWWGLTYASPTEEVITSTLNGLGLSLDTIGPAEYAEYRELAKEKIRDEGLVLVDHSMEAMEEVETTKKYHAFAQFSRYIKPGYVRIQTSEVAPLLISAFVDPRESKVVLVIINPDGRNVPVVVSGLPSGTALTEVVRTSADSNAVSAETPATSSLEVTAMSVTTLVYSIPNNTISSRLLVRHAPVVNGSLDGSVQMLTGESFVIKGSAWVSGDLLVPGTPVVQVVGTPTFGGTIDGTGSINPSFYVVTIADNALLGRVVRRVDPARMPLVGRPPGPTGTRVVSLTNPSQSPGDFETVRNLSLNASAGLVKVPPGTYGSFSASGNSGFELGIPNSTVPVVYNFQSLALNVLPGNARIQIVGPVIVNLANGALLNGNVGSQANPEWLALNIAGGGFTISGNVRFNGSVVAPNSTVTLNVNAILYGTVVADRLVINGTSSVIDPNP